MTTSTSEGTCSRNTSSSESPTAVPVGLFGVQTSTIRVRGVIAAAIAARSCRSPAPSGTCTGTAPASVTRIGYASNDRQANTTSSPGSQVAAMSCPSTPTDPGPSASRSAGTSSRAASAAVRVGDRHVGVPVHRARRLAHDVEHRRQRRVGVLVAADLVGRDPGLRRRRPAGRVGRQGVERAAQAHRGRPVRAASRGCRRSWRPL